MAAIQAWVDNKRFGVMPYAGGSFDQEPWLMREMHQVAVIIEREQTAELERQREASKRGTTRHRGAGRRILRGA